MKEYGTLAYVQATLEQGGVIEKCAQSYLDESRLTLVLIVTTYRFRCEMVTITRTSRKCFRVEHGGKMRNFRTYTPAALYVSDLVTEILEQKNRRENYGEIYMQQIRADAIAQNKPLGGTRR